MRCVFPRNMNRYTINYMRAEKTKICLTLQEPARIGQKVNRKWIVFQSNPFEIHVRGRGSQTPGGRGRQASVVAFSARTDFLEGQGLGPVSVVPFPSRTAFAEG